MLLSTAAFSQADLKADLEAKVDHAVYEELQDGQAVGLSVAVVQNGKIILTKQYGLASRMHKSKVKENTEFPIGSVSKQFTAACILLLAQDRRLSLDDKVAKYFPNLKRAEDVSIRDLLNHVSGYPDWYPLDYPDARILRPTAPETVLETYGAGPLDFEPGSYFSYSNTSYLMAARVVEKVSGKSFFSFLERRILKPLHMSHTHEYQLSGRNVVDRYTSFFGGPMELAELESPGWMLGAGGLLSTAEDLAKWDIALLSGKILSRDSWAQMTAPRKLLTGMTSNYGFGQSLGYTFGHPDISHRGGVSGSIADNEILPEDNCAFAWLSNYDVTPFGPLNSAIFGALIPEGARRQAPAAPGDPSPPIFVNAPPANQVAKDLYNQILAGKLDRSLLTPECSEYLSDERLKENHLRLSELGPPLSVTLEGTDERGQMQVANILFRFKTAAYRVLMYRHRDGKIAEFMVGS